MPTTSGGWGAVVYHSYATPEAIPTFEEFRARFQDVRRAFSIGPMPPAFVSREMDAPATAWSEFRYWVFSYIPRNSL